jgi:hypothetical protein
MLGSYGAEATTEGGMEQRYYRQFVDCAYSLGIKQTLCPPEYSTHRKAEETVQDVSDYLSGHKSLRRKSSQNYFKIGYELHRLQKLGTLPETEYRDRRTISAYGECSKNIIQAITELRDTRADVREIERIILEVIEMTQRRIEKCRSISEDTFAKRFNSLEESLKHQLLNTAVPSASPASSMPPFFTPLPPSFSDFYELGSNGSFLRLCYYSRDNSKESKRNWHKKYENFQTHARRLKIECSTEWRGPRFDGDDTDISDILERVGCYLLESRPPPAAAYYYLGLAIATGEVMGVSARGVLKTPDELPNFRSAFKEDFETYQYNVGKAVQQFKDAGIDISIQVERITNILLEQVEHPLEDSFDERWATAVRDLQAQLFARAPTTQMEAHAEPAGPFAGPR